MDGIDTQFVTHLANGPALLFGLAVLVRIFLAVRKIQRAKAQKKAVAEGLKVFTVHFAGIDGDTPEAKALRKIVGKLDKDLGGAVRIVTTPREAENGLITFTANPVTTLTFNPPAGQPVDETVRTLRFRRVDLTDVIEELLFLRLATVPEPAWDYAFLNDDRAESHTVLMAYVGEMPAQPDTIDIICMTIRYGHWRAPDYPQLEALIHKALTIITPDNDPVRWRYLQNVLINIRREAGRLRDALVIAEAAEALVPVSNGVWVTELKYAIGLNEPWVEAGMPLIEAFHLNRIATTVDDYGSHSRIRLELAQAFLEAGEVFKRREWRAKARDYAQQCLDTSVYEHGTAATERRAGEIVETVNAVLTTDSAHRVTVSVSKTIH